MTDKICVASRVARAIKVIVSSLIKLHVFDSLSFFIKSQIIFEIVVLGRSFLSEHFTQAFFFHVSAVEIKYYVMIIS